MSGPHAIVPAVHRAERYNRSRLPFRRGVLSNSRSEGNDMSQEEDIGGAKIIEVADHLNAAAKALSAIVVDRVGADDFAPQTQQALLKLFPELLRLRNEVAEYAEDFRAEH